MTELVRKSDLWMRPVSFLVLLRIVHLVAQYPNGIAPGRLDAEVKERALLSTKSGSGPARATLYHHRNALVHLGVLERNGQKLQINPDNPHGRTLLGSPDSGRLWLDPVARDAFSELVVADPACRRRFFDLFVPPELEGSYDLRQFRVLGSPVLWERLRKDSGPAEVLLRAEDGDRVSTLRSQSEIKGVLYGLRYWARDELTLVDEFFREGRGSVLYPVLPPEANPTPREVVGEILSLLDPDREWTTLSVRRLITELCEKRRRTLASLFEALRVLEQEHPRYIVLVPTSSSFATLTARSLAREEFELRSYFRDVKGRYISHLRIHNSIGRQSHV